MKISATVLLLMMLARLCLSAEAQPIDPNTGLPIVIPPQSTAIRNPVPPDLSTTPPSKELEPEHRFDLDFKGGSPKNLVDQVEKSAKTPLNAIVPEEHADFVLPPLKLRNVTVPQLFEAMTKASAKVERYNMGPPNSFQFQQYTRSFGFRTSDARPNANSIWYFFMDSPPAPPAQAPTAAKAVCRFWQLDRYLDVLKIEDITTAIETGWKMLAVSPPPKLSFHKDTKLLIVVGQQDQLLLVDDVLRELRELTARVDPTTGLPIPKGPTQKGQPAAGEKR